MIKKFKREHFQLLPTYLMTVSRYGGHVLFQVSLIWKPYIMQNETRWNYFLGVFMPEIK